MLYWFVDAMCILVIRIHEGFWFYRFKSYDFVDLDQHDVYTIFISLFTVKGDVVTLYDNL